MAGHSKWANIKHKKGRADAKKGKIFSRFAKEIISAVKLGGGSDPKANARLRLVLQKARAVNVPKEIIERNIKKACSADQADYVEMTYELYGHGGIGLIVEVMTDNKNRIASEMRIATNKMGGSIATPGSVAFNFDRKGILQFVKSQYLEEDLLAAAIESGAEDVDQTDDQFVVVTDPADLYKVKETLDEGGFTAEEASLERIPKVSVACDQETAQSNEKLIAWLEELDDVDAVYHNMDSPD